MERLKKCPKCKEEIQSKATKCKHCGAEMGFQAGMKGLGKGLFGCGCALMLLPLVIIIILLIVGIL